MLLLNATEIEALLPLPRCIELMADAMRCTSSGDSVLPLRQFMAVPGARGKLGLMPGYLGQPACFGVKIVSKFERAAGSAHGSHVGAVMLFDATEGLPLALMDGGRLTALRTAATSAMATGVLARADAAVLLLCGAGEEAWWHARALSLVRPLQRVLVWARSAERAARFAARVTQELQLPCEVATTLRGAVAQADIICTATSAAEPYLMGEWLRPGTHLTLVGSAVAHTSEVDAATVAAARFFVDYRAAALQQAGELIAAVQAGVVSFEHIAGEIGEVLLGRVPGRRSRDEITIYKSLGVCTQDLAAACEVHAVARERGVGMSFDLQG